MNRHPVPVLAPAALALAAAASAAPGQMYSVTELAPLNGQAAAHALNEQGVAVGASTAPSSHFHAVRWDAGPSDLGGLPGLAESFASAVDDSGRVYGVGYGFGQVGGAAFSWQDGVLSPLGPFEPAGCNQSGQLVGSTVISTSGLALERACLYSAGSLSVLPTLGGLSSEAYAIDPAGRIVGSSLTPANTVPHACLWIAGTPSDLGGLGGPRAQARAIAEGGLIAGFSELPSGPAHAVLYRVDPAGQVLSRTDLGSLRAGASSFATGVNASGRVVGTSDGRAFAWSDGEMIDLNTAIDPGAGWRLEVAAAINGPGAIVGWGSRDGQPAAFLLTPLAPCPVDLNGDGLVDFADYLEFLNLYDSADPRVDFNGDGLVDFADYLEFLNLYDAGC